MYEERVEVVPLNQRAPKEAYDAYKERVFENHGRTEYIAGPEFEREVRAFVDMGAEHRNRELIQNLGDTVGQAPREEKFSQGGYPDHTDTTVVRYHLPVDLVAKLKAIAEDDFRSITELIGRIMWRYAVDGSITQRNNQKLERIHTAVERKTDSSLSATEKATNALIEALDLDDDGKPFTMDDFDTANQKSIEKGERYARKTYLPKVLDELDYTWSGSAVGVFVPSDVPHDPVETRDPRTKPYVLMDDDDMARAVRLAAYESVADTQRTHAKYSTDDAVDTLQGRPTRTTVRKAMRHVAAENPGFKYDDGDDVLKLNARKTEVPSEYEPDTEPVPEPKEDMTEEPEPTTDEVETDTPLGEPESDWFDSAVSLLEDTPDKALESAGENIAQNKIARAKYPDEIKDNGVSDEAFESVTDDEIQRVLDSVLSDDEEEIGETEQEIDAEMEMLESATRFPAMTDGGQPID